MKKFPLKWRLLVPIIISLIIGMSALIIFTAIASVTNQTGLAKENLMNMTFEKATLVKSEFEITIEAINVLRDSFEVMIQNGRSVDIGRDTCTDMLEKILYDTPRMLSIFAYFKPNAFDKNDIQNINAMASDSTGKYAPYFTRNSTSTGVDLQFASFAYDDSTFAFTWDLKKEFLMEPYIYDGTYMTSIFIPIIIDGETIGVIGTDISLKNMSDEFQKEQIYDTGDLFLISPEGWIAVHTNDNVLGKNFFDVESDITYALTETINSPSKGNIVKSYSNISKKESLYAFTSFTIGNSGNYWIVGVTAPTGEVLASVYFSVAVLILSSVLILLVTASILYTSINKSSNTISNLTSKLTNQSEQLNYISDSVASSSEKISQGGKEQASSIEETSATMNETTAMIELNSRNTKRALVLTRETSAKADEGANNVKHLIDFMKKLSKSGMEISNIIDTIDGIAMQTNILALNASVEAAKAGETGKAFSVVAEEVRSLAQRCNEAVKSTSSIIKNNLNLTDGGLKSSQSVSESFNIITTGILEIEQLINQITTASIEQSQGVSQINTVISHMEIVMQESASMSEQNSTSAEKMKNVMNELTNITMLFKKLVEGI